ncbi:exosortase A [Wenzhouxiangella sp. XN24]|uniref:exosortase A n=1 Tax=Wenzhouxiangella sp. XN24 TaxID=2713569 RepID=UPI0013EC67AD|nr:exosortase A [Wenzhouxiangella sp. XN24]NGX17074.1 EpsI family protein [Wenzhouxiangella sp. XN24]
MFDADQAGANRTRAPATRRDAAIGAPSALRWPLFLLSILLVGALYWPTLAKLLGRWISDPTYSHGFLVAALGAWMTWRAWRRGELEGTRPSWLGLLPIAGAGLAWLLASAASIQVVQQLTLPALVLGAAWALFGWRGFLVFAVPIGVVYFVLPAWDYASPLLQGLTVVAVSEFLHSVGVPAFIHGHRVDLPNGSFEVVEGCSGLHFFMAAAALATIQSYLYIGAHWARATLVFAALVVAIVANWIRVAAVIVAGYATDMQHFLVTTDHYYFGWVVFAIMMLPVLYLGRRLELAAPPAPAPAPGPALSFAWTPPGRAPVVLAFIALALPALAWTALERFAAVAPAPELPAAAGGWRLEGEASPDWRPVQPGAESLTGGSYSDGRHTVDAWVAYYPRQSGGRELVGYGNAKARPDDGRLAAQSPGELRLSRGARGDRLIWYRYEIGGRVTTSAGRAKLYQLAGTLGRRPSAYGLFVSTRCAAADCSDARATLQAFTTAFGGDLPGLEEQ